jgi:hypothetical protein
VHIQTQLRLFKVDASCKLPILRISPRQACSMARYQSPSSRTQCLLYCAGAPADEACPETLRSNATKHSYSRKLHVSPTPESTHVRSMLVVNPYNQIMPATQVAAAPAVVNCVPLAHCWVSLIMRLVFRSLAACTTVDPTLAGRDNPWWQHRLHQPNYYRQCSLPSMA